MSDVVPNAVDDVGYADDDERSAAGPYAPWRWLIWGTWAYLIVVTIAFCGLAGMLPPTPQSWSAEQVRGFLLENHDLKMAGFLIYALSAPLYVTFSVIASKLLQRIEGRFGVLYLLELVGGIGGAVLFQATGLFWTTAAFRADTRSAESTQLLFDLGWFFFDLTFTIGLLQMISIGIVVVRDRSRRPLLPKWLGWLCFGVAAAQLPLVLIPWLFEGPFAWNGLVNFFGTFGLYTLFMAAVMLTSQWAVAELERRDADLIRAEHARSD